MILKTYKIIETNEIIDLKHSSLNDPNWEFAIKVNNDYIGLLHNQGTFCSHAKRVVRNFTAPPLLFKGNGFYCTDYKKNESESNNES